MVCIKLILNSIYSYFCKTQARVNLPFCACGDTVLKAATQSGRIGNQLSEPAVYFPPSFSPWEQKASVLFPPSFVNTFTPGRASAQALRSPRAKKAALQRGAVVHRVAVAQEAALSPVGGLICCLPIRVPTTQIHFGKRGMCCVVPWDCCCLASFDKQATEVLSQLFGHKNRLNLSFFALSLPCLL